MGNIFSIRLTDEDKVHLQQRMNETGKNATEVFKSAIYFTEIDADLVDEIISNIGYYASEKDLEGIKEEVHCMAMISFDTEAFLGQQKVK